VRLLHRVSLGDSHDQNPRHPFLTGFINVSRAHGPPSGRFPKVNNGGTPSGSLELAFRSSEPHTTSRDVPAPTKDVTFPLFYLLSSASTGELVYSSQARITRTLR